MAKLLCMANWPDDGKTYPDYPIEMELTLTALDERWLTCMTTLSVRRGAEPDKAILSQRRGTILARDLSRLLADLKTLVQQHVTDGITFVPVVPSFELWVNRLSDDQYRVIVWLDMAEDFQGANDIAYDGLRFTSNRARLMGFIRGLEADLS